MPRVTIVRYAAKPEHAEENEALSRAVYEELRREAPAQIAYALFRDGTEFLHLFVNTNADSSDALTELPSFKTYQKDILARCVAPPQVTRVGFALIDAYGLELRLETMHPARSSSTPKANCGKAALRPSPSPPGNPRARPIPTTSRRRAPRACRPPPRPPARRSPR